MRHISSAPGCLGHRRADSRIAGTYIPPATGIVTNTHDMRRQSRTEVETGAKSGGRARRSYLPNTTYSGLVKQPDKHELARPRGTGVPPVGTGGSTLGPGHATSRLANASFRRGRPVWSSGFSLPRACAT